MGPAPTGTPRPAKGGGGVDDDGAEAHLGKLLPEPACGGAHNVRPTSVGPTSKDRAGGVSSGRASAASTLACRRQPAS
jgi:hypothetical protein